MIRRSFLKSGTLVVVAAGAGPVLVFGGRPARGESEAFTRAQFEALVDQWFYVDDGAHPTLELIRVDDGPTAAGLEQFTAVFRGPAGSQLTDAQHVLRLEGADALSLHLAPAGSDAEGSYFVAAFSLQQPWARGCAAA